MKKYAIIVAGGGGTRMKSNIPKQYLLLDGRPILMHTIEAFFNYSTEISIILVLPKKTVPMWKELCKKHSFSAPISIVYGGNSRYQSVKNGLDSIKDHTGLVAIHDGVRPLVDQRTIMESFRLAEIHGNAVASMPLKESLVFYDGRTSKSINRSEYRSIQTPQTFKTELIKSAYKKTPEDPTLTDDASVAEKQGVNIVLFDGSYTNIKVTTPEDMLVAEAFLKSK